MKKVLCAVLALLLVLTSLPAVALAEDTGTVGTPKGIAVTPTGSTSATVSWDSQAGADSFIVMRSLKKDSGFKKVAEVGGTAVSASVKGLSTGKVYYYRVYAVAGGQKSAAGKTVAKRAVPAEVNGIRTTRLSTTSIRIKWNGQKNVTGYHVYVATSENGKYTYAGKTTLTNIVVNRLSMGKTYWVKVRSYKTVGSTMYFSAPGSAVKKYMNKIAKTFADYAPTVNMTFEELAGDNGSNKKPHPPKAGTYRIIVDIYHSVVMVYKKDSSGKYTIPVRYMLCASGKASTPTRIGTFSIKNDKVRFGTFSQSVGGESAQYWSLIVSATFFHTILYKGQYANNYRPSYKQLGTRVTHGCVRLTVPDARWIYYNAAVGTTVIVRRGSSSDRATAKIRKQLKLAKYPKKHVTLRKGDIPNTDNWLP